MRGQERERAKNPKGFLKMFSSISQEACQPPGPAVSAAGRCSVGGLPASQLSVPTGQPGSQSCYTVGRSIRPVSQPAAAEWAYLLSISQ